MIKIITTLCLILTVSTFAQKSKSKVKPKSQSTIDCTEIDYYNQSQSVGAKNLDLYRKQVPKNLSNDTYLRMIKKLEDESNKSEEEQFAQNRLFHSEFCYKWFILVKDFERESNPENRERIFKWSEYSKIIEEYKNINNKEFTNSDIINETEPYKYSISGKYYYPIKKWLDNISQKTRDSITIIYKKQLKKRECEINIAAKKRDIIYYKISAINYWTD